MPGSENAVAGRDQCCSRRRSAAASPAILPASRLTIAAAQALPCACAAEADFGMPPAMAGVADDMDIRAQLRVQRSTGSIGHQPVLSAAPAISAMRPAFCGGMTLATCGGVIAEIGDDGVGRGIDRRDPAALRQRDPFDHAGIKLLPRLLEQALLGKAVLGVEDQDLRARLVGLQIMRDQAGALVRRGRAAQRRGRHRDHDQRRRPPSPRAAGAAASSARRPSRHAASSRPRLRHSRAARRSAGRCRAPAPAGRR